MGYQDALQESSTSLRALEKTNKETGIEGVTYLAQESQRRKQYTCRKHTFFTIILDYTDQTQYNSMIDQSCPVSVSKVGRAVAASRGPEVQGLWVRGVP